MGGYYMTIQRFQLAHARGQIPNSRRSGLHRRRGPARLRRRARNRATGLRSLVRELAKQFASSLNEAIQVECVGRNAASSPDMLPFQRLINNH